MNSNEGKQKFFVIYQITNLLDNRIYIGAHSTFNINDKYMGSSKYLKKDLKELGRRNFKKEILHIFDNKEDMIKTEAEIVNKEFCHRFDTYNRMIGGISELSWNDMISVKDSNGNNLRVYRDDPRYLSGEFQANTKGTIMVKDTDSNIFRVKKDDPQYLSGEFISIQTGIIVVKDKEGNIFRVEKNDERYLSGELTGYSRGREQHTNFSWKGKEHKEESKQKIGLANSLKQKGESNSQFGTCWVTKAGKNKKIKKEELELYLYDDWKKGRK